MMSNAFEIGQEIATKRARILEVCLLRDHVLATSMFQDLKTFVGSARLDAENMREADCRLLETELDISEISADPASAIAETLLTIHRAECFSSARRAEVMERGLVKIKGLES